MNDQKEIKTPNKQMSDGIDPVLNPLLVSFFRLGIKKFLVSNAFKRLMLELNSYQLWKILLDSKKRTAKPYPSINEEYRQAFGQLLTLFHTKLVEKEFLGFLEHLLFEFARYGDEKEFSEVKERILGLGYTKENVER
ncbi:MAG: hypothetical protein ACFFE8_15775, partial [Candidatus Heimdallarchaeota archaeon]